MLAIGVASDALWAISRVAAVVADSETSFAVAEGAKTTVIGCAAMAGSPFSATAATTACFGICHFAGKVGQT